MTKAILTTKVDPTCDDLPEERYHFPRTYLRPMEEAKGDWIIYYEPRRTRGKIVPSHFSCVFRACLGRCGRWTAEGEECGGACGRQSSMSEQGKMRLTGHEYYVPEIEGGRMNSDHIDDLIRNWLRNRSTLDFPGIWEQPNNPDFNPVEFDGMRRQAGKTKQ